MPTPRNARHGRSRRARGRASPAKALPPLLRDEIAHTLADAAEVDEEMRALFGAFAE